MTRLGPVGPSLQRRLEARPRAISAALLPRSIATKSSIVRWYLPSALHLHRRPLQKQLRTHLQRCSAIGDGSGQDGSQDDGTAGEQAPSESEAGSADATAGEQAPGEPEADAADVPNGRPLEAKDVGEVLPPVVRGVVREEDNAGAGEEEEDFDIDALIDDLTVEPGACTLAACCGRGAESTAKGAAAAVTTGVPPLPELGSLTSSARHLWEWRCVVGP